MKKFLLGCLAAFLAMGMAGCAKQAAQPSPQAAEGAGISVVATIFPIYDFAREITRGTDARVEMLLKPGIESHSFDPAPSDIIKVQTADLFCYIGGESDAWVEQVLSGLDQTHMRPLKLIDCVEGLGEEVVEGMQGAPHAHAQGDPDEGIDEHIWTSPRNARLMARTMAESLCAVDPKNADAYQANLARYEKELVALDQSFVDVVEGGARREIIFGDRFPFRYFANAYGLTYYAAFPSCSGESEPSAATIAFLIKKIQEDAIPAIYHIEQGNLRTANVIAEETGAVVLELHACHNITKDALAAGETYLSLMRKNVEALRVGLS
ncbi:MAG: metal ABC transporter substrate-binding protein [Clostridia bacterium]